MQVIEFLAFLAAAIVVPIIIPKKKEYRYNVLDKIGIATNIVLSLLYIPLSLVGLTMVFFFDNPEVNPVQFVILMISVLHGIAIPAVSIASIALSAITRKRGMSKISFIIQFAPIAVFILAILFLFSMALFNWI